MASTFQSQPALRGSVLDNTFGAFLLGTFIALPLYGLTLAQTIRYAHLYPSDRPLLKTLVAAIFILDTIQSAINIQICYHYLVTDAFAPTALFINTWTVDLLPFSTGITVLITQGFYTRRIYVVTGGNHKYRILVFFVILCLSAELGLLIADSIESFKSNTFGDLGAFIWINSANLAIVTIVDLVLTSAFVTIMRQSRTGFRRTEITLYPLVRYAVFATVLFSALAIPAFICSIVLSQSFVYMAILGPATKVYANSVLAMLNCRKFLPGLGNMSPSMEIGTIKLSALGGRCTLPDQSALEGGNATAAGVALPDSVLDTRVVGVKLGAGCGKLMTEA